MIYRLIIGEIQFNYAKIMKNQSLPKQQNSAFKSDIGVLLVSRSQTYLSPIFTENGSFIIHLIGSLQSSFFLHS